MRAHVGMGFIWSLLPPLFFALCTRAAPTDCKLIPFSLIAR